MAHRAYQNFDILSAAGTTGAGNIIRVDDYKDVAISYVTDGGGDATLTINIQGSIQTEKPDFDAPISPTNHWSYIESIDVDTGTVTTGTAGYPAASADISGLVEVNTNTLKWITVNVTARTAGEVTVKAKAFE